jgi:hypothetical protein
MNLTSWRPAPRRLAALALVLAVAPSGVAVATAARADPLATSTTRPTTTIVADCADFVHAPPCTTTITPPRPTTSSTRPTTTTILADCWDFAHVWPDCPPRPTSSTTTTTTVHHPRLPAWLIALLRWLFGIPG